MSEATPAPTSKDEWREWAKARRGEVDWDTMSGLVRKGLLSWDGLRGDPSVLIYLPMAHEINLRPLVDSGLECRWLATRTPRSGHTLTVHELGGPLEVHPFGYLQPHESAPEVHPSDIDAYLVPGLVFDLWGRRLGWGAGYYDRLLAMARPDVPIVGIVPTGLVVDRLPADAYDVPMTDLATEEGVITTARS